MTVAALTPSVSYAENGITLNFAAPFRYLDPSQLVVERITAAGLITPLVYGVAWTATAGPTDAGGTVTLVASVAGNTLRIRRGTPRAQPLDYVANDRFPAETHELALDRAMLIAQELETLIGIANADLALLIARVAVLEAGTAAIGALGKNNVLALENIAAGDFVHCDQVAGVINVRKANATNAALWANGFAPAGIVNGSTGTIIGMGPNTAVTVPAGASQVWLSETVPGGYQTVLPSAVGSIIQPLSLLPAIPGGGIFFTPMMWSGPL